MQLKDHWKICSKLIGIKSVWIAIHSNVANLISPNLETSRYIAKLIKKLKFFEMVQRAEKKLIQVFRWNLFNDYASIFSVVDKISLRNSPKYTLY